MIAYTLNDYSERCQESFRLKFPVANQVNSSICESVETIISQEDIGILTRLNQ